MQMNTKLNDKNLAALEDMQKDEDLGMATPAMFGETKVDVKAELPSLPQLQTLTKSVKIAHLTPPRDRLTLLKLRIYDPIANQIGLNMVIG